jgi:hypothetical protein
LVAPKAAHRPHVPQGMHHSLDGNRPVRHQPSVQSQPSEAHLRNDLTTVAATDAVHIGLSSVSTHDHHDVLSEDVAQTQDHRQESLRVGTL